MAIAPPLFLFPLGIWPLSLWATRVTARPCGSWVAALGIGPRPCASGVFRSLKATPVLCTPVSTERPLLCLGNKGQWGFEAETCGLWKHLEILMDSHTWVKRRHLGFVSGWEAPDCSRYGVCVRSGAEEGLSLTSLWLWLCAATNPEAFCLRPQRPGLSLQQGLVLLRSCKQPVVVRKKQHFIFHSGMDMKENLKSTNPTVNLPLPKNPVLRSWFLKWTVCSCWAFGWL